MARRIFGARTVIGAVVATSLVGGAVAAAALLATAGKPTSPARATATQLHQYEPWTGGHPAPGLHVLTATGDASCWEGSLLSPRRDAYRCSTTRTYDGGNLFDPCFAAPTDGHRFLCPSEPLGGHRVVGLTAPAPGPSNAPTAGQAGTPWEFELSGGATCRAVSGATQVVAGQRANYVCSDKRWLWGEPTTSSPQWTIRSSRSIESAQFTEVAIVAAWY